MWTPRVLGRGFEFLPHVRSVCRTSTVREPSVRLTVNFLICTHSLDGFKRVCLIFDLFFYPRVVRFASGRSLEARRQCEDVERCVAPGGGFRHRASTRTDVRGWWWSGRRQ